MLLLNSYPENFVQETVKQIMWEISDAPSCGARDELYGTAFVQLSNSVRFHIIDAVFPAW